MTRASLLIAVLFAFDREALLALMDDGELQRRARNDNDDHAWRFFWGASHVIESDVARRACRALAFDLYWGTPS